MSQIYAVLFDFGGLQAEEGISNGPEAQALLHMTREAMEAAYDSGLMQAGQTRLNYGLCGVCIPVCAAVYSPDV